MNILARIKLLRPNKGEKSMKNH